MKAERRPLLLLLLLVAGELDVQATTVRSLTGVKALSSAGLWQQKCGRMPSRLQQNLKSVSQKIPALRGVLDVVQETSPLHGALGKFAAALMSGHVWDFEENETDGAQTQQKQGPKIALPDLSATKKTDESKAGTVETSKTNENTSSAKLQGAVKRLKELLPKRNKEDKVNKSIPQRLAPRGIQEYRLSSGVDEDIEILPQPYQLRKKRVEDSASSDSDPSTNQAIEDELEDESRMSISSDVPQETLSTPVNVYAETHHPGILSVSRPVLLKTQLAQKMNNQLLSATQLRLIALSIVVLSIAALLSTMLCVVFTREDL